MTLRVLSTLAVKGALPALVQAFERNTGISVQADYGPTLSLLQRVRQGEADVALMTRQGIDDMIAEGAIMSGSAVDLARSYVGIAVRTGAPVPPLGTVDELKATLLAAGSIARSQAGASGVYFAALIQRLGLAEALAPKITVIATGLTAELAADGRVDLAVQQISELMQVPGVTVAGPLPMELQEPALFSGGLLRVCTDAAAGRDFLTFIAGSAEALKAAGLEPVPG